MTQPNRVSISAEVVIDSGIGGRRLHPRALPLHYDCSEQQADNDRVGRSDGKYIQQL